MQESLRAPVLIYCLTSVCVLYISSRVELLPEGTIGGSDLHAGHRAWLIFAVADSVSTAINFLIIFYFNEPGLCVHHSISKADASFFWLSVIWARMVCGCDFVLYWALKNKEKRLKKIDMGLFLHC